MIALIITAYILFVIGNGCLLSYLGDRYPQNKVVKFLTRDEYYLSHEKIWFVAFFGIVALPAMTATVMILSPFYLLITLMGNLSCIMSNKGSRHKYLADQKLLELPPIQEAGANYRTLPYEKVDRPEKIG